MSLSSSPRPSAVHTCTTDGTVAASFMRSLNSESMPSKRFVSSGSCARMSAEARKMDSSAAQLLHTLFHSERTDSTSPSVCCQYMTLSRK